MSKNFPRQDILETQKTPKWFKEHGNFAEDLLRNSDHRVQEMNRFYQGYNGQNDPKSVEWLTKAYGVQNRGKYIDYRVGRNKIDILLGEWLRQPFKSTVRTINSSAVVKKMQTYTLNLGAVNAKPTLEMLRGHGVDPMEGMDIPDKNDPNLQDKITPKDRNEIIMQRIVDAVVEELHVVEKIGSNFLDAEITSRVMSRINVDKIHGSISLEPIDPRDGIYFEFDRDPFMKKSFLMGSRTKVPINEILTKFKLTRDQRNKLESIRSNQNKYLSQDRPHSNRYGKYSMNNGHFCVDVMHIEWLGVKPKYTKKSPKTKSQMDFSDNQEGFVDITLGSANYETNADTTYKNDIIVTEWEETVYELTRIGDDMDILFGEKEFQMRDRDTGKPSLSYTSMIVKPVNGESISLQQIIENFSNIHNITMYQALKEIAKIKGKVITYNRAGLPKGTTIKQVLYRVFNDSFLDYNSAGQGNMGSQNLGINDIIKEIDLGLSTSFGQLLAFKNDNLAAMDRITGINEYREGNTPASATLGNAEAARMSSSTITEPLFFYMNEYTEIVMTKLAETAKIVWGLYKPEKLRTLLGDDDYEYIKDNPEIANNSYGVYMTNGRKEQFLREKINAYADAYANKGEIPFMDLVDYTMADSLAEARRVIQQGWNRVEKMKQQAADKQLVAQQQISAEQQATQIKIAAENREDAQKNEKDNIILQGKVDMALETVKAKNKFVQDVHQNDMETLDANHESDSQVQFE